MTTIKRPVFIMELVGIAGAGKTSLLKLLKQNNERIQLVIPPGKSRYLSFIGKQIYFWLPIYLGNNRQGRYFTYKEIAIMGYLEKWILYLREQIHTKDIVCVLDPGSIYWLYELRNSGSAIIRSQKFKGWFNKMLHQWASFLDMIIWIDAPDEILLERVLDRDQWHKGKEQSKKKTFEDFAHERKGFGQIIAIMEEICRPKVLSFRSDQISTEQMANRVLTEMNLEDNQTQNE